MFHYKRLKMCVGNRTIGYWIIQCVVGFPVNGCVPMRSVTSEYSAIYTDCSPNCDRIAMTAVFGEHGYYVRLPSTSSTISVEANAMFLALKFVASSSESQFMICSDSLSCLLAIESCKTQNLKCV
jgi:hypothetical protein